MPGSFIRGIEIDNPSGQWLLIPSLETFIPPYTEGWSYGFPYDVSSIDIIVGNGPAGQIGTQQGEAPVVVLTDSEIGSSQGSPSPGAPFTEQFTPVLYVQDQRGVHTISQGFLPSLQIQLIAPVTNKRIRLLTLAASLIPSVEDGGMATSVIFSDINALPVPRIYKQLSVSIDSPTDSIEYANGFDLPIGTGLWWENFGGTVFHDITLSAAVSYQLI